jgi:A/G-specific adenine glycosylase
MPSSLVKKLLAWYRAGHRALPWRGLHDPYPIWISEIMLQQTQVVTVIPYYTRWLARFPTVQALAQASEQEVLALWEGLGYYSRARNLHRAAQQIVKEHHGHFPNTVEGLLALPGIGRYTAAAIASLAFGADAAVLDGNVKRVLARVFDFQADVKSSSGEKQLWALAQSLVPKGEAGGYNQAIMDLGATVCTPRAPACDDCPLHKLCRARVLGVQLERPIIPARAPVPHHTLAIGVIRKRGRVLIVQRPRAELLGGLWAFPGGEKHKKKNLTASLRRRIREDWRLEIEAGEETQTLTHAFSHFKITAHVFECQWHSGALSRGANARWVRVSELNDYPMGKVDRQIARRLQSNSVGRR